MASNPPRSVSEAAHRALVAALDGSWTGTVHVVRTATGVTARIEGVAVIVPVPTVRWGASHAEALAALQAADTLQPLGAWEWVLRVRAGIPLAGLTWIGIDDPPATVL